ncbi:PAS domain S-box protein [Achromobacter sp. GG226]|uniref:PAS domain-containing protein n=1 Tax=Verticiella alkaliphila TaxID=2779529 RepID=UPI001C0CF8AB|nr:PAS domain S-box protein [Verticiella sp. GG226]MBU4610769.1 PAS domain S-box protein [Verticiella sp. GG226]
MLSTLIARILRRPGPRSMSHLAAISESHAVLELDADGVIVSANATLLRLFGYAQDALEGHDHRVLMPASDRDTPAYLALRSALRNGTPCQGRYRHVDSLGRDVWMHATYTPIRNRRGDALGTVLAGVDVTADMQRLSDMEGQIAAISRSQAVIAFALDGTILDANDSFLATMGYTRAEVVGQHHRMFVGAETAATPAYTAFWERLGSGHYDANIYRRLGKGGRDVWIQATYNPIFDQDGRRSRWSSTPPTSRGRSTVRAWSWTPWGT